MTKEDLTQFRARGQEIKMERARMAKLQEDLTRFEAAAIAVKGSLPFPPYTQRSVMVGTGEAVHLEYKAEIADLKRKIDMLTEQRRAVREYIGSIPDSEVRQIFTLRYLDGLSWQAVAYKMGEYDESLVRKKHNRYLKFPKFPKFPKIP